MSYVLDHPDRYMRQCTASGNYAEGSIEYAMRPDADHNVMFTAVVCADGSFVLKDRYQAVVERADVIEAARARVAAYIDTHHSYALVMATLVAAGYSIAYTPVFTRLVYGQPREIAQAIASLKERALEAWEAFLPVMRAVHRV